MIARQTRRLALIAVVLMGLLLIGFLLFANWTMRRVNAGNGPFDGIVVLTGAAHRIQAGMQLLEGGLGERLLISGVNRVTKRGELKQLVASEARRFDCCVDLGYQALNTRGNAGEISRWARRHGYRRLAVVTSNYHMPRALAEIASALPEADLTPHVIFPDALREGPWWLNAKATRLIVSEYIKYIPAVARLAVVRLSGPIASGGSPPLEIRNTRPQSDARPEQVGSAGAAF